jgi:hypothetical protein
MDMNRRSLFGALLGAPVAVAAAIKSAAAAPQVPIEITYLPATPLYYVEIECGGGGGGYSGNDIRALLDRIGEQPGTPIAL